MPWSGPHHRGLPAGRAHVLRMQGRTEQRGRLPGLKAPAAGLVHTEQDLGAALATEYERAGAPPLSRFVSPAEGHKPIPRTTTWRIIRRQGLPADAEQLQTFLDVCRVGRTAQRHYREAYRRLAALRRRRAPRRHIVRRTSVAEPARGTDKIPKYDSDLLDLMSEENIETVLMFGVARSSCTLKRITSQSTETAACGSSTPKACREGPGALGSVYAAAGARSGDRCRRGAGREGQPGAGAPTRDVGQGVVVPAGPGVGRTACLPEARPGVGRRSAVTAGRGAGRRWGAPPSSIMV